MKEKNLKLKKRSSRVRYNLKQKSNRNRLSVFKSRNHIYVQIIDDSTSSTLASASTLEKGVRVHNKSNCNINSAIKVGELIAQRAVECSCDLVVFDRGPYAYHGVIKALAETARKKIKF